MFSFLTAQIKMEGVYKFLVVILMFQAGGECLQELRKFSLIFYFMIHFLLCNNHVQFRKS